MSYQFISSFFLFSRVVVSCLRAQIHGGAVARRGTVYVRGGLTQRVIFMWVCTAKSHGGNFLS